MKKLIFLLVVFLFIFACKWTTGVSSDSDYVDDQNYVELVSNISLSGNTHFLKIQDYSAYVLNSTSGLFQILIGDPYYIEIEENYQMDGFATDTWKEGMVITTGNLTFIDKNVFDEWEFFSSMNYSNISDVAVKGDFVYAVEHDYGLRIIDTSNNYFINEISDYYIGQGANSIILAENQIFIRSDFGVTCLNVSNQYLPSLTGEIFFDGLIDFTFDGNYLYLTDGLHLKIYRAEDNFLVSEKVIDTDVICMDYSANKLYIGGSNYDITVYDVTDKYSPQYEYDWYCDGEVMDIEVIQNYIFIANGYNGFVVQRYQNYDK